MDKKCKKKDGYISKSYIPDWLEEELGGDYMHNFYSSLRSSGMDEFDANVLCLLIVPLERKSIDVDKLLSSSSYLVDIMKKEKLGYFYPDYKQKFLDFWQRIPPFLKSVLINKL